MKQNILIVDDHDVVREGVRSMLSRWPKEFEVVHEAANARDAITYAVGNRVDVAVVDMSLGRGASGLSVVETIKDVVPHIIMKTVEDRPEIARSVLKAGAKGYVLKDDGLGALVEAIRHVVAGRGSYISAGISSALASADAPATLLSTREQEVFHLMSQGFTSAGIAEELHIAQKTVETHKRNARIKLGCETSEALLALAVRHVGRVPRQAA